MFEALRPTMKHKKYHRKITFAVNASLLKNSVIPLKWLCEQFDASLTLWQSKPEHPVDIAELIYIRSMFPKSRIYYDLQPDTMVKFKDVADKTKLISPGA